MNVFILIIMGLSWGLHFALIKMVSVLVSPYILLFPTLSSIALLFFLLVKCKEKITTINLLTLKFFIISGVLGYLFPILLELIVAREIEASLLTLIMTTTPLVTIATTYLLGVGSINIKQIGASVLGMIGIMILFSPSAVLSSGHERYWIFVSFLIPISYAIYNVYIAKYWPKDLSPLQVAMGESVAAAVLALPFFVQKLNGANIMSVKSNLVVVVGLIIATAVEVWAFFELIKRTGPVYVSFSSFVTLFSGCFWGWLFFDEKITTSMFISGFFIIASILLLNYRRLHYIKTYA